MCVNKTTKQNYFTESYGHRIILLEQEGFLLMVLCAYFGEGKGAVDPYIS